MTWHRAVVGGHGTRRSVQCLRHHPAVDGLVFEQLGDEPVQRRALIAEQVDGARFGLPEQPGNLLVDDPLGFRGVGPVPAILNRQVLRSVGGVADRPQRRTLTAAADPVK